MFRPLRTDQDNNKASRAYFMLAAGGRVVRSHHHLDASSNNRLMVPTEKELKTILYDQTGARAMAHNRRENIDYVALHADRRRRRATRMTEDFERESHQVAVSAITESPCRERGSANPYRRLASNPPKGTYLGHRLVGPDDNSAQQKMEVDDLHPCPSPEEEVPVSVFLDSFSAFGMTTADTTQAVEVAPDSQPSCQDHAPGKPTDRAEATASTEAAYELSEPLAKVDLYSILCKARPAETRNGPSGAEVASNLQLPTRGKNKRFGRSTQRREKAGGGKQRLIEAAPTLKVAYLARDPLGDEVADLDAKLQENARRLKQETAQQQPPQATDITRQAALLAEKLMQQSSHNVESSAPCANANVNPILATTKSDRATSTQGLDRHGDGAMRLDRGQKKRDFVSTTNTTTALPHRVGRRVWAGSTGERGFAKRKTCRCKPIQLRVGNGEMVCSEEKPTGMTAGRVYETRTGLGDSVSVEHAGGKNVLQIEFRKGVDSKPRRRWKGPERKDREEVQSRDEETSFQSGVGNEKHASRGEASVTGTESRRGLSCSGGAVEVLTEDAAALQIEACWRGFLGRCAAKHELRSVLLDALRKVGGGRISKAMALGDVAEGDRLHLDHALRTATQSRRPLRQLPPQAQILECAHFVAVFQRRHAKEVNVRKKRWVAERKKKMGVERARARCGLLKPVPTAQKHVLRFVQACE